jgi:oligoendopeptidase F
MNLMEENNSNDLDFSKIPPYQPRRFVSDNVDLSNVGQVVMLYNKLYERNITSVEQLETFLLDRSELDTALRQHNALLYIRMTCQTDDSIRAEAYKKFVETILPAVKPLADKLDRKYLDDSKSFALDKKRYEVYNRNVRADVELFREENVPLQTKEDLLSQEYQTVCGAMMVNFQGQEHTMAQMWKFLEQTDKSVRESAWRVAANRRLQDVKRLDAILDKMLELRQQIAANAGFDNYRDYKFHEYHRFDYTVEDCKRYHDAVEKLVIPVLANIYEQRKSHMGLASLRPWDFDVDPQGRDPLEPFETIDDYLARTKQVFSRLDPELGDQFQEMIDLGLLDLASRKGKAPGGYQENLWEARKPFIFGNVVGTDYDIRLIMHEGGHAFHALDCADESLLSYRDPPIEFCEVASMSMELFALPHLGLFYNELDTKRSYRLHLESIIRSLSSVAAIDAFQHWLYENANHTCSQRRKAWRRIYNRFGGGLINWSGLEIQQEYLYQRILHIFKVPLYYIEYGIAQLGALGLWLQSIHDTCSALANYRKALALGGSRPLPELFAAAGLEFDFSEKTIAPLIDAIAEELTK